MVQQTYQGPPSDPSPGDVISSSSFGDKVRQFILSVVKDGTEDTAGQTSNLLLDADSGRWQLYGADMGRAISWTPLVDSPSGTFGTSQSKGTYVRHGHLVTVWARVVVSSNTASGDLKSTLPVAADDTLDGIVVSTSDGAGTSVGTWHVRDDSDGSGNVGNAHLRTTTSLKFLIAGASPALQADHARLTGSGDVFTFCVTYPVATV